MKNSRINPTRIILYSIAVALYTIACNSNKEIKEPEFFMIERIASENGFVETFVVANPPKDTNKLKSLVEHFNLITIPIDTIIKYKEINRRFYKETELLTRDYKRFEPYPNENKLGWYEKIYYKNQDLVRHHDDLIMITLFSRRWDDSLVYEYCYQYSDYAFGMREEVIDLDSLYQEGAGS